MRKLLLSICAFVLVIDCIAATYTNSNQNDKVPLVLTTKANNQGGGKLPRSPIHFPNAYIDGHTITFDSSCIGCSITLLQDDIIIYSATVEENDDMEGEVVLPDYLTGVFELQLERGSITFVGEIEL